MAYYASCPKKFFEIVDREWLIIIKLICKSDKKTYRDVKIEPSGVMKKCNSFSSYKVLIL